jgi:TnpA family transposase
MYRRSLLAPEVERLFALPTDPDLIIRHYTLDEIDRAHVVRRRRPPNRFGFALQLCALRYPGRRIAPGEAVPLEIVQYLCDQLDELEGDVLSYAARAPTRSEHLEKLRELYGYRPFAKIDEQAYADWLAATAWRVADGPNVAAAFLERLRADRIEAPTDKRFGRLVRTYLAASDGKAIRMIANALTVEQKRKLDALLEKTDDPRLSRLGWCRQMPKAVGADTILRLLRQRATLRCIGLDAGVFAGISDKRRHALGAEAARLTADNFEAIGKASRRRALLAVAVIDLEPTILDAAIETFDRFVGQMHRRDKNRRAERLLENQRAVEEHLDLLARLCDAVSAAHAKGEDPTPQIAGVIPLATLPAIAQSARALKRQTRIDYGVIARNHLSQIRRVVGALLKVCVFEEPSGPHFLKMLDCLKTFYEDDAKTQPDSVILTLRGRRWIASMFENNDFQMAAYEFWTMVELRQRLRSGGISIAGSHNHRPIEEKLMPSEDWASLKAAGPWCLAVPQDVEAYLTDRRALLNRRIEEVGASAAAGMLSGVRFTSDGFTIDPLEADETSAKANRALQQRIQAEIPRARITKVMADVCEWTRFDTAFPMTRYGRPSQNPLLLLAVILARATGIGLEAMAHASNVASHKQLAHTETWYFSDAAFDAATARLTEAMRTHPLAPAFGSGDHSSSDGQHFPLRGKVRRWGAVNPHKETQPSVSTYTHVSDQYAPFHTRLISVSESEAAHVVDGLFYRGAPPFGAVHHTDGGGVSDHVFGLCALFGIHFVPRIPRLPKRMLYTFETPPKDSPFRTCIARRLDVGVIHAQWDSLLRLGASIQSGDVAASWMLKRFAAYPAQNDLGRALQEIGRLGRTLYTLDWLDSLDLRQKANAELNKGEERNRMARQIVSIGGGYMRLSTEKLQHSARALNLLTAIITYWNMEHMWRAVQSLRSAGEEITDDEIARLSPLRWRHINLHGDYIWPQRAFDLMNRPRDRQAA